MAQKKSLLLGVGEVGLQRETRQKKRWQHPLSHKTEEKEDHSCKLNACLAKESENK